MIRTPSLHRAGAAAPPTIHSLDDVEARLGAWLSRYSVTLLRLSLGAVFLGFGVLKFFPGVSPAENIATTTMSRMTLGMIPPNVSIYLVASLETVIGLLLLSGRFMRLTFVLLAVQFVGILSPLVLLTSRLFSGPNGAPTLEGQYVLKDVILLAGCMVVFGHYFSKRAQGRVEAPSHELEPQVQTE